MNHRKKIFSLCSLLSTPYFLYDQQNEVYAWGNNTFGQLGLTHSQQCRFPELINHSPQELYAKGPVSGFLEDGRLFIFGRNKNDIFNLNSIDNIMQPLDIGEGQGMAIGFNHMGKINNNVIYLWGSNSHQKLGSQLEKESRFNNKNRQNDLEYKINQLKKNISEIIPQGIVKKLLCGRDFTLYLNEQGEIYQWGEKNTLSFQTETDLGTPQKVKLPVEIIDVECGQDFVIALGKDQNVYSWGQNKYGQLGQGEQAQQQTISQIRGLQQIEKISSGDYFSAAINKSGDLFTWGYGMDGQLSNNSKQNSYNPIKVDFKEKVLDVSCGGGHLAILTHQRQLYMVGKGRDGQLGRAEQIESSASSRSLPRIVEFFLKRRIIQVKCGGDHTLAILQ